MAEPTIQLGGGNWAGKTDNLLGYYKEGERFYKQDFTFSRSTTGTYTDSDGYIQEMPYNLALYSEEFNNAAYSLTESSITANAINSPIGTLTADKLVENTSNNLHRVGQGSISVISGEVYTFSFYVKAAERNELELQRINTSGTVFNSISVTTANLTNGTLSVGSNVTASSIENVGSGWYRISISLTAIANGSGGFNIGMQKNGSVSYQGDGVSGVYVWGFQAVKGTSAKTYFPTTTRLNMPRVDYLNNSNGSLILEPQRTNLLTWSNFQSGWVLDDASIVSNSTTSPDGTLNANLFKGNTNSSRHNISKPYTQQNSTATLSVFAKAKELRYLQIATANTPNQYVNFDVSDGAIGTVGSAFADAKIEDYGNGWYRLSVVSAISNSFYLSLVSGLSASWLESWVIPNNTDGLYIWEAQSELGSYATSLINTSGSSVTRNADGCSITNVADRINSSEGVLFAEIVALANDGSLRLMQLSDGTNNNRVSLYYDVSSNIIYSNIVVGGSSNPLSYNVNILEYIKVAVKWKENDFALWVNGTEVATDTSGSTFTPNTLNDLSFNLNGIYDFYGKVKDLKVYNTALTDSELATLTT